AALALNEDSGPGGRNLRDGVEEAKHRLAFADDVLKVVALLERALELDDFFFGAAPGDGGANVRQQLLVVPRLLNEVLRAGADGIDYVGYRAEGRDHDDGQRRLHLQDLRQQFQAALAGEGEIEEQQIEFAVGQLIDARGAVHSGGHLEAFEGEQFLQRFANGRLVVDDQDACRADDASIACIG